MHRLFKSFGVALFLVLPALSFAQGERGAITGLVTDPTGAVVPDATVKATDTRTTVSTTVKSSSAGYYRVGAVPPGVYRLEATKAGFKTAVAENIAVPVAQVVTIDFTLQVGNVAQSVTVTSEAPLLTPSTAEVGGNITPEELSILPINLDDGMRQLQTFLFASLPGTVGESFQGSINGGQFFSHEILIDGITIGNYTLSGGGLNESTPSADAVSEFKLQSANYSAEYGASGSGVANFGMKSGSNEYHVALYEYFKNDVLAARGFNVNSLPPVPDNPALNAKPPLRENNFGFDFGGPLTIPKIYHGKNRTFFFLNYEGDRRRRPSPGGLITMATQDMRQGDFSAWLGPQIGTDALGRPVYKGEIFDPTTTRDVTAGVIDPVTGLTATDDAVIRDPFAYNGQLNVIPPDEFSRATSVLLPLFPNPINSNLLRNYPSISGCCPLQNVDVGSIKIDHVVNERHKVSSFFMINNRPLLKRSATLFPPLPSGDFWPVLNPIKRQVVTARTFRMAEDWTVNNHTLNHLAFGFNRFSNPNGITPTQGWPTRLGLTGVADRNFPRIRVNGKGLSYGQYGVGGYSISNSESFILTDTLSWLRGKHSYKFGAEIRRYHYNSREFFGESGRFNFSDRETSLPGFPIGSKGTGHPFASFILGAVDSGSRDIHLTQPGYRVWFGAFYAQDDWKITSKLTLNYGLRWDIPGVRKEAFDRQSGLDQSVPNPGADGIPGALVFLGNCQGCNGRDSFQDSYYKEFGPRLGFAYAATHKLVIRGGYGISYAPPIENNFGSQNLFGFNGTVNMFARRAPTGFKIDPVIYWTPLVGAAVPSAYQPGSGVGVPPFTETLPDRRPEAANGSGIDFLARNTAAQPYVQNWSAGFQYELPAHILLEANYVGSKGTRLEDGSFALLYNQAPSKYMALGDVLAEDITDHPEIPLPYPTFADTNFNPTVGQSLRPFPQYDSITSNYNYNGNSSYHSLQLMARKRTGHGLNFIAAYTYSKALTNTDNALYYPSYVQDFYNRKLEKSVASFHYPHNLKLTWIYDLPFGRGKKWVQGGGALDRLVGGWKVTGIQHYSSGNPLAVVTEIDNSGIGGSTPRPDITAGVAQTVPWQGTVDAIDGTQYLNTAAFGDPPISDGNGFPLRFGTAPRFLSSTRGPAQVSEDFGILKDTSITERVKLRFRTDFFNAFNRAGRGNPDTDTASSTFGRITGPQQGPRFIMLSMRLDF